MHNLWVTAGGYAAALVLGWLWIGEKENLASEIERCNTDKLGAVLEAEKTARAAAERAYNSELAARTLALRNEQKAREIVTEALRQAETRPDRVRTVIERVKEYDSCLVAPVPADLLQCLRTDQDCGETGPG